MAAALAPVLVLLAVVAAWAIDTGASGGEVLRNVELAGEDIGGMGTDELMDAVEELDAQTVDRPVRIETPEATYETTAGEIGLSVNRSVTADAALEEGRVTVLPLRPFQWLAGFVSPRQVEVEYAVDHESARTTIRSLEGDARQAPVEPTIQSVDGGPFEPVPGQAGSGIDPQALARSLTAAARESPVDEPVHVRISQSPMAPQLEDSVAGTAAERANQLTSSTLAVIAGDMTVQLVPRELRQLAVAREQEETITVILDPARLEAVLDEELAPLEVAPADASITLADGVPVVTPGVTGISCCDEAAVKAVQTAFETGQPSVTVELTETEPERTTEEVESWGIVEEVGSPDAFGPTTRHQCCQNRVTNIHRIADIVRGAVIPPGETFSVNDYVGQRTREKGFVADGVIYDGVLTEDVGGGVSQFATTLFNAALFAGLDIPSYQSHSLYISRYPRGHEATISYPNPDLVIENSTEFGVMLWPTYTETSITVHLYSTRHIDVQIGEPTPSPQGNCTRWTTPRTRTYPNGETTRDTVSAVYRPNEGVDC
jgi:vancomycin resistance protein YoaR